MNVHMGMRSASFAEYWRAAASPVPLVVVGGGRWGRQWAGVIADARGGAENITIAARSDPDSVREWLITQPNLHGVKIASSLHGAMTADPPPAAAIIASRPADHSRDAMDALELGLHILIEKPIAPQSQDSWKLISAAARAGRTLAVGTEFSLLPAFHIAAAALVGRLREPAQLTLYWQDPARDERYGQLKTYHAETGLLVDLLPHAFSIFHIFAPDPLYLAAANLSPDGQSGALTFTDGSGGRYALVCDRTAEQRVRRLQISSGTMSAIIDFAEHPAKISIDGRERALDPKLTEMPSTLRLELGAFLMDITGAETGTPITAHVADLVRLHTELESVLLAGGHH